MRAILCGDIHLSDKPPSIRTDTYADDILAKLRFAVDQANEHADVLVLLGDVFHVKTPSKTSHRLVQQTAQVLEACHHRVLIVPGNHDMSQDRIESLPSQPLGSLALSPNVELLMGYDQATGIYGIPYLNDWPGLLPGWLDRMPPETALVATHAPIFPPGEDPPYDFVSATDWSDTMGAAPGSGIIGSYGLIPVAYGHIHDQHGFYQAGSGRWFCNNGAISRGSLHEETLKREPKITLFNPDHDNGIDLCPFISIDVPHCPAADVFRLVEHTEQKATQQRLDAFLTDIGDVSVTALSIEDVLAHAATSGLSARAQAELAEIVEAAVHG